MECGEQVFLEVGDAGDAADGCGGLTDADLMLLQALQLLECGFGRQVGVGGFQALAHDAVEDEGEEADAGVSPDVAGQAVEDGADLDFGLEHAEAALDVGEGLVAGDDLAGRQRCIGDEEEFAVHEFGESEGVLVEGVGEAFAVHVGAQDVGEVGFFDGVVEARLGAAVGESSAAGGSAVVLSVELAGPCCGLGFEGGDAVTPRTGAGSGDFGVVGDDQAQVSTGLVCVGLGCAGTYSHTDAKSPRPKTPTRSARLVISKLW